MDFHTITTQYKKQFIIGLIVVGAVIVAVGAYVLFFRATPSGTLLELSPDEIARRLRNEGREDSVMSEDERIRSNPIGYVETLLPYYYTTRTFALSSDWTQAEVSIDALVAGLEKWEDVSLAEVQKDQVRLYKDAANDVKRAIENRDLGELERAYTGLRYLEIIVLEYRSDQQ